VGTTDRTLTVESIGSDKQSGGLLETRGEDPGYVLSGYGTEYHLITTGTPYWRAVDIVCSPASQLDSALPRWRLLRRATMPEQDHENADRGDLPDLGLRAYATDEHSNGDLPRTSKGATSTGSRRVLANTPGRP